MGSSPFTLKQDLDISMLELLQLGRLVATLPNRYPWSIIPPDGVGFDPMVVIPTPAPGAGPGFSPGVETVVNTLQVPDGYDGIITHISNNFLGASFNPGLPSLTWRIRVGASIAQSRFVRDYDNIIVEFGETKFPREIAGIFLSSGQTFLYTVTNNDPAIAPGPGTQVACCFSGFYWPQQRSVEAGLR